MNDDKNDDILLFERVFQIKILIFVKGYPLVILNVNKSHNWVSQLDDEQQQEVELNFKMETN